MYEVYGGLLKEDIVCTINGQKVCCPPESTILEAARSAGIEIPTLCYLKGLTPTGACGICAVEIEEEEGRIIRRACRVRARDGMVIHTNTPKVLEFRKARLTEILRKHPNDCLTCQKTGGNCQLQIVSQILGVNPAKRTMPGRGIDDSSPAMIRDMDKCIACGRCVTVCNEVQKIGIYEMKCNDATGERYVNTKKNVGLSATACINCGQCVKVCPVGALSEKDSIHKALAALDDPETTVVWQMAPAIQNTLGEEFCMAPGTDVTGKIAAAMKKLGGYAFTTDFSADVTIMEEGTEFIDRVTNGGVLPMMTSCCPGWIKYMEYNYPDQLDHLSSCKSPQQMFGALVKNYLPGKIGVPAEKICHISIMPCVAKKYEHNRPEMESENGRDVDIVLTTREAAKLFKLRGINLATLNDEKFDSFMGEGTGAARIFGTTGGVMEAALRTVVYKLTGGKVDQLDYHAARGYRGVKEASLTIGELEVKVAIVNGIGNVKAVMDDVRAGKSPYHFIEVMACPGGCLNGGGAPLLSSPDQVADRMVKMYESDEKNPVRRSHENTQVQELYRDYLEEPCGHLSHHLLHTTYVDRTNEVE
ncbi:MAG: [FeFe] hydrogenase, group A [Blautia sp.]|nr:[FeFe] hydrogenase, group A [Blautia sp.]MDY3999695.1 [FeFe] hydrogenase, group A [Blautia sp.]